MEYYGRKITYADLIVNVKKTPAASARWASKSGDIITVVSVMTPECHFYAFYAADRIHSHPEPWWTPLQRRRHPREYIEEVDSPPALPERGVRALLRQGQSAPSTWKRSSSLSPADFLPLVWPSATRPPIPRNRYKSNVMWKAVHRERQERQSSSEGAPTRTTPVSSFTPAAPPAPKGVMLTDRLLQRHCDAVPALRGLFHRGRSS